MTLAGQQVVKLVHRETDIALAEDAAPSVDSEPSTESPDYVMNPDIEMLFKINKPDHSASSVSYTWQLG